MVAAIGPMVAGAATGDIYWMAWGFVPAAALGIFGISMGVYLTVVDGGI